MNVFGKNERSWRKARKRGVSPIIATILLVAITVVLAAVLYVLISGLTGGGVGSKPIGSAFSAGSAIMWKQTVGAGNTYAATGCNGVTTADYCYTLTVETTGATFSNVLFEVKTSTGAIAAATTGVGGFSVLNIAGNVVAQMTTASATLAMTATFGTYYTTTTTACNGAACGPSTPWSSIYTIVVDMGQAPVPTGQGYSLVAVGTGGYSGTTAVSLP
ncbi:MAG: archaellin/type IV pilin N-terminal domain-containing protein [Thermoplasmata archaeon]